MAVIVSVVNSVSSMSDDAPPAPRRSILHRTPYRGGNQAGGGARARHPAAPTSRTHLLYVFTALIRPRPLFTIQQQTTENLQSVNNVSKRIVTRARLLHTR